MTIQEELETAVHLLAEACCFIRQKGFVPLYRAELFLLEQNYPHALTRQGSAYGDIWRVRDEGHKLELGEHQVEWGQLE